MMSHVSEHEFLVVVRLLLVDVEVCAVKVEQTVRKLVARESTYRQVAIVAVVHAADGERASVCPRYLLSNNHFSRLFTSFNLAFVRFLAIF